MGREIIVVMNGAAEVTTSKMLKRRRSALGTQNPWWAQAIIYLILFVLGLITFIPILNVLAISFSEASQIRLNPMMLIPQQFTLSAYEYIFSTPILTRSFF